MGNRIKELRKEKSITQKELSEIIGLAHNTISAYESGQRDMSTDTIDKICNYFEVTADYLLGRSSKKEGVIMDNIPQELRNIGIDYLTVTKELKEKGLTPENVRAIIDAFTKLK